MYLFERLLQAVRAWAHRKRTFDVDFQTLESLRLIAEREQLSAEDLAKKMLQEGVRMHQQRNINLLMWSSLSPREQEVVALVCLHYTNRQIASRLHISPETVKSHMAHAFLKFNVPNRQALRMALDEWDFSQWDDEP